MKKLAILLSLGVLAACSGPTTRLDYQTPVSDVRLNALVGSAMVRTVSLPTYAAAEELSVETSPGIITADDALLWADAPDRAVTLQLAGQLDAILNATVGPEPWPFAGLPDVSIDVRVSDMLAGADGMFRLKGQTFVGGDGRDFRNSADTFDIAIPVGDVTVPGAIAVAQGEAIKQLAEQIARRLGR